MKLIIEEDYESMSAKTAERIINTIIKKPDAVLCLAAGDTPRRAYQLVADKVKSEQLDISNCYFVSLDEWVGIGPENEGSCQYFLRTTLFQPMKIAEKQIHVFDSLAMDLSTECVEMDNFIREHGGIDLMVVGIGRNGHIGFNEPGVDPGLYSHVVDLDSTTTSVGQKYFKESTFLSQGITLGLKYLAEAREAILIANGEKKADVIKEALEGEISPAMPAGYIREHANAYVILDKLAASGLDKYASR